MCTRFKTNTILELLLNRVYILRMTSLGYINFSGKYLQYRRQNKYHNRTSLGREAHTYGMLT